MTTRPPLIVRALLVTVGFALLFGAMILTKETKVSISKNAIKGAIHEVMPISYSDDKVKISGQYAHVVSLLPSGEIDIFLETEVEALGFKSDLMIAIKSGIDYKDGEFVLSNVKVAEFIHRLQDHGSKDYADELIDFTLLSEDTLKIAKPRATAMVLEAFEGALVRSPGASLDSSYEPWRMGRIRTSEDTMTAVMYPNNQTIISVASVPMVIFGALMALFGLAVVRVERVDNKEKHDSATPS